MLITTFRHKFSIESNKNCAVENSLLYRRGKKKLTEDNSKTQYISRTYTRGYLKSDHKYTETTRTRLDLAGGNEFSYLSHPPLIMIIRIYNTSQYTHQPLRIKVSPSRRTLGSSRALVRYLRGRIPEQIDKSFRGSAAPDSASSNYAHGYTCALREIIGDPLCKRVENVARITHSDVIT